MDTSKIIAVIAVVVSILVLAVNKEAKAEGYEGYGDTYNTDNSVNAAAQSKSESESSSVAVSPNNVSIQQPNNSVTTVHQPASAYAPSVVMQATSPCRIAWGAAAGFISGAFGIGSSIEDEDCTRRETYRMGIVSTDEDIRAAAKAVYMNLKSVKETGIMSAQASAPAGTPTITAAKTVKKVEVLASREEKCFAMGGTWRVRGASVLCDTRGL